MHKSDLNEHLDDFFFFLISHSTIGNFPQVYTFTLAAGGHVPDNNIKLEWINNTQKAANA